MSNTSQKMTRQLGMPIGTASNRLRKMLLFSFACQLGKDYCFKCGAQIETVDELSVEHKEPWFDRENGVEKFWNLDNIAFSHLVCNRPNRQYRIHPEGMKRCSICREVKEFKEFNKNTYRKDGVQNHCRTCHKTWRQRGHVA